MSSYFFKYSFEFALIYEFIHTCIYCMQGIFSPFVLIVRVLILKGQIENDYVLNF